MRPPHHVLLAAGLTLLPMLSCQSRQAPAWNPKDPAQVVPIGTRRVVVAPVALGPLATINPEGRTKYSESIVRELSVTGSSARYFLGPNLPDADAVVWNQGPVDAVRGADAVLLAKVLGFTTKHMPGTERRVEAEVQVRLLDVDGRELITRTARGQAPDVQQVKFRSPGARPESLATSSALNRALDDIALYLRAQGNQQSVKPMVPGAMPDPIRLRIQSTPPGASIFWNEEFLGTTPSEVSLLPSKGRLRLERHNYQRWQVELEPKAGMEINPAMELIPVEAPAVEKRIIIRSEEYIPLSSTEPLKAL